MSDVIHRVVPEGSIDTHVHVFDPKWFAYADDRDYTPAEADLEAVQAYGDSIGLDRFVFVQPSVYGTDNSALLAALKLHGADRARAVAVVGPETSNGELDVLHAAGVRGLRLNVKSNPDGGKADIRDPLRALIARAAPYGMAVEIFCSASSLAGASDIIAASPVPVILDHFGGIKVAEDGRASGAEQVIELLGLPHIWVKLSAPYRIAAIGTGSPAIPEIVQALVKARPERLVWASDWPHTGGGADRKRRGPDAVEPFRDIDDIAETTGFVSWLKSEQTARQILVDNPSTLFDF
ncbi:amidohydrolase family protein [Arthrobacter sp. StoSoilB22]|uniref:amidohydrolase family protein n=1 Tax=Arthrobacter sp. StoSoilB22 TaxID=2830996 RepID=UPI001CC758C5|nr:amidohydrolase family protein [Arthrobacter sp. StoSoilB22]BCW62836.1 hydrolase [Arthrobacter sp. StoSoilB22]